jgi:hypothetical protein
LRNSLSMTSTNPTHHPGVMVSAVHSLRDMMFSTCGWFQAELES